MGILGSIFNSATGNSSDTTNPSAMGGILEMLTGGNTGGLHGIIDRMKANGLGHIVDSWIGKGENQPVEPGKLQNALGSDMMGQFASKMGVSETEAATHLSNILPTVVDKLTPDGELPEPSKLGNVEDMIKKFL